MQKSEIELNKQQLQNLVNEFMQEKSSADTLLEIAAMAQTLYNKLI